MAIDGPGAIDAALGFEPERRGGRRGADLFGARGMPAQDRRCSKAIEAKPSSGQIKP